MDLWIRSQDGGYLAKTTEVGIERENRPEEKYVIYCNPTENSFARLGYYDDEERAKEIIAEIYKRIQNNVIETRTNGNPINEWRYYYNTNIIYEMPKE